MYRSIGRAQPTARYENSKNSSINAPVLERFDPKKKIVVTSDACKYSMGAVMEKTHDDRQNPVPFISRNLNQHEQNYAAYDLELLGIVDTLRSWRCYLQGQKFVIHSDYHQLK